MHSNERRLFLRTLPKQDAALNDVRFVDDTSVLHVVGPGHVSETDLGTLIHISNVPDSDRGASLRLKKSLPDILGARKQPESADVHLLLAYLDKTSAGIDVIVGELLLYLADA